MKHTCLFRLLIPVVILSLTITSVFYSTLENHTILQQAQKALDANQKEVATVLPEPVPNVVPSAIQGIQGIDETDFRISKALLIEIFSGVSPDNKCVIFRAHPIDEAIHLGKSLI
jgi:hypothetical protein